MLSKQVASSKTYPGLACGKQQLKASKLIIIKLTPVLTILSLLQKKRRSSLSKFVNDLDFDIRHCLITMESNYWLVNLIIGSRGLWTPMNYWYTVEIYNKRNSIHIEVATLVICTCQITDIYIKLYICNTNKWTRFL